MEASHAKSRNDIDRVGTVCSAACAAHCAAIAFFPGALAAVGMTTLFRPASEWGLTLVAAVLAAVALFMGWRRHGSPGVVGGLGAGIAGLLSARMLEAMGAHGAGTWLGIFAGLALVAGHLGNVRATRRVASKGARSP